MSIESATASITFGTSGWTGDVTNIDWSGISRAVLDTTHLGTTTARTFKAASLYDPGSISVTWNADLKATGFPPYAGAAETVTVSVPSTGAGSSSTLSASGQVTDFGFTVAEGADITGTMTVKLSGALTVND